MIVHVHYYFCKMHMIIKIFVLYMYMVLIDVLVDSYATKKSKTNFKKNEICEMDELSWVMFYVPSQNSMILIVAL